MQMRKALLEKTNQLVNHNNMFYRFLIILAVSTWFISCSDLPADLQARKTACIKKYDELIIREDTITRNWEYDQLIVDYTKLSNDVISYTSDCNKRGIKKNNDEMLKGINYRISTFKKKLAEMEEKPSSYGSSSGSTTYSADKTCSWCGKSFSGSHYTHLGKMSDCYSTNSTTSIGYYCSLKCCSEARRSSCPTCR